MQRRQVEPAVLSDEERGRIRTAFITFGSQSREELEILLGAPDGIPAVEVFGESRACHGDNSMNATLRRAQLPFQIKEVSKQPHRAYGNRVLAIVRWEKRSASAADALRKPP